MCVGGGGGGGGGWWIRNVRFLKILKQRGGDEKK